ncbi:thiamine pyrophosphate-binding protein [Mesorhizobium australicum]|uniref:Acetolactate synthase large subunit n=1 Tax=Mesorhizobium australicum TaxID=536018 RepID=A0A1X7PLH6_9HYPH|nr:thiamine pyrophosphate-binding protein [Mesorhizobium australicum]SMH51645.1 Acetolactate synthase large subunit [Mesorhizobium australicum]
MVTTIKVYEALARALAQAEVGALFGVTGDANVYLIDCFVRAHAGSFVAAANENGAALMALGYASVSGKVGFATVTHGPAVTNTLTALAEGVKAGTPMVLICGDTIYGDRQNLQNIAQRDLIVATGAGFEQLHRPETAVDDLARAIRRAQAERRPVAFNCPADLMWRPVEADLPPMLASMAKPVVVPSVEDLENAVGIIATARRPIVLAGRDAIDDASRVAMLRLAERIDAPVATTLRARSLFRDADHNLGIMGTLSTPKAVDAIMASDCILAFGAGLNFHTTSDGGFVKGKRIVQVAADAAGIGRGHAPDVGLVGSVAEAVDGIIRWLDEAEIAPSGFRGELPATGLAAYPPTTPAEGEGGPLDYVDMLPRLDAILPADRVLVTDAGRHMIRAMQYLDVESPRLYVQTASFGSIGLGLPQAIGAAVAEPRRPVVLTIGDGGFMLGGLGEFNTAVRHRTDLIVILCNDNCYGAEYAQLRDKQMDPSISRFDWPDFAPIADALGGQGVIVRSAADLDTVREAIEHRDRPLLIELKLDADRMPFW